MSELREMLLKWMSDNEKLAGWAQFAGAMLAVVIAIWVPWYQARAAERAVRAARFESELASVQGVYFVLADVSIWLKAVSGRGPIPRSMFPVALETSDLLERIRLWELREQNEHLVSALFMARGAVIRAHETLSLVFLQAEPITDVERVRLASSVERIRDAIKKVDEQRERLYFARQMNKSFWFLKPFVILGWYLPTGWIDRLNPWKAAK